MSPNERYVVLAAGENAYEYGYVVDMMSELPEGYADEIERGNLVVYAKFTGPGDSPKQAAEAFCDMLVVKNRGCGVMINGNVNRFCLRFLAHMIKSPHLQRKDEAADLLADLCCLDLDRVGISYEQRLAISRLCTVSLSDS